MSAVTYAQGQRISLGASACNLCGSKQAEVVSTKGRGGVALYTGVCVDCGNIFTVPRPSREDLARLYETGEFSAQGRGASGFSRKHLLKTYTTAMKRWEYLTRIEGFSPDASILDVGSGMGAFLRLAKLAGHRVEGIEPDREIAEETARIFDVPVHSTSIESVELPSGSFDVVVSFHTIEHVLGPLEFVRELRRLAVPGGIIVVECPALDHGHTATVEDFFWAPHINVFTEKTLRGFFRKAGLEVLHSGPGALGVVVIGRVPRDESQTPTDLDLPLQTVNEVKELIRGYGAGGGDLPPVLPAQLRDLVPKDVRVWLGKVRRVLREPSRAGELFAPKDQSAPDRESVFNPAPVASRPRRFHHIGLHRPGNAGDTVLFETVRSLFDQLHGRQRYDLIELQKPFVAAEVRAVNAQADGLLVGGGGLIIPDSNPNENSGWQWDVTLDDLRLLQKPLICFAIGFNLFRGQDQPEHPFTEHIRETVRKAAFFGMRNHGSMRKLREYLPEELHDKVVYQPCMTTILSKLVRPELLAVPRNEPRRLGINLAFDREDLRFPGDLYTPLERVAAFARQATERGWAVDYVAHTRQDRIGEIAFRRLGVNYRLVNLEKKPTREVLSYYRGINLAIGMRGHAQMMPFGMGTPIFSLISHDKMAYFLEDIERPAWGAEVMDPELTAKLDSFLSTLTPEAEKTLREDIAKIQERLWEITRANVEQVFAAIE